MARGDGWRRLRAGIRRRGDRQREPQKQSLGRHAAILVGRRRGFDRQHGAVLRATGKPGGKAIEWWLPASLDRRLDLIGQRFGNYRAVYLLDEGGMGAVYL